MKNETDNKEVSGYKDIVSKEILGCLKGIAIILMFAVHLLKAEWIIAPELIVDIEIANEPISFILARACDICIGIFAFITGYSWYVSFKKKSIVRRLLDIYLSYWLCLTITGITYCINEYCSERTLPVLGMTQIMLSIMGISSEASRYCWYISFFALATITYRPIMSIIDRIRISKNKLIVLVLITSFACRICSRVAFLYAPIRLPSFLAGVMSHYWQWIPVVIIGSLSKKFSIVELHRKTMSKYFVGDENIIGIVSCSLACSILLIKAVIQYVTKRYSNFDSFIILPFVLCLISSLHWMTMLDKMISKALICILRKLGGVSLYMWLLHCVLRYDYIQKIIYRFRLSLLVLAVSLLLMYVVALAIYRLDSWLHKLFWKGKV